MLIYYTLGTMHGKVNSKILYKRSGAGIFKKDSYMDLEMDGNLIDKAIGVDFVLRNLIIFFYIGKKKLVY